MFEHGFPEDWSTIKKLIHLVKAAGGGASYIWKTVTGTLIHITDALASPMQKCEVSLEPVQDLHGQDAPYPAGGGSQLIDEDTLSWYTSATAQDVSSTFSNGIWTLTNGHTGQRTCFLNIGTFPAGTYYLFCESASSATSIFVKPLADDSTTLGTLTVGQNALTLTLTEELAIKLMLYAPSGTSTLTKLFFSKTNTSYSPYSNICPITGWTGAEVTRTGKNICDESILETYGATKEANGSYYVAFGSVLFDRVVFENKKCLSGSFSVAFKYKYNSSSSAGVRPVFTYTDGTRAEQYVTPTETEATFTATTNSAKTLKDIRFSYGSGSVESWINIAVALGSDTIAYEPFSGNIYSVTFPDGQTVYGGTVDLVSGVLTVDRAGVDLGSLTWSTISKRASSNALNGIAKGTASSELPNMIGEAVKIVKGSSTLNTIGEMAFINRDSVYLLYAYYDGVTLPSGLLVYELATPTEIQLTPQEISTLKGVNNVWSNTNSDTTVIYKAQAE